MKKENSLIRSQSEQRTREVCHLEEELGKVKVCLSQSQNFAEEMRGEFSNGGVLYIFFTFTYLFCMSRGQFDERTLPFTIWLLSIKLRSLG